MKSHMMTITRRAALAGIAALAAAGCCSFCDCGTTGSYPENIEEGFISLFDGQTLLGWEGDIAAFKGEFNPVCGYFGRGAKRKPFCSDGYALCYTPKDGVPFQKIATRKEYDNFVLRFCYLVSTNATAAVGLRTPAGACPCKDGVAVALADDFGLANANLGDRYAGSLIGIAPAWHGPNGRSKYRGEATNGYAKPTEFWNMVEVRAVGPRVTVMLNGEIVSDAEVKNRPAKGRIVLLGLDKPVKWMNLRVKRVAADWKPNAEPIVALKPAGFTQVFDGMTLANWKGVTRTEDFDRPWVRQAATPAKRAAMQAKADELMRKFWHVRDGALFFDGKEGGYSLATAKDYADFEMYADWRILTVNGDSGFYPRGVCQVQIWDAHNMWHLGSGGLYNNKANERHAMSIADKTPGDWNRCYMKMVGDRITVRLNGVTVVDDVPLENANAKKWPGPIPACEQIELQCHGDPLEFRNIFIREL